MYTIDFDPKLKKTLSKWRKSNPLLFKKLTKILYSIQEDPYHGIGHPEPLIGGNGITYSRRVSDHDRIIYEIYADIVLVLVIALEGHYNDK